MTSRSRRLGVLVVVGAVAVGVGSWALLGGTRSGPPPSPSATGRLIAVDRPALSPDGRIRDADLQHDSRDDLYRAPGGAVPGGTPVTLRARAAAGDLTAAEVRVSDGRAGTSVVVPMIRAATDAAAGEHGYDYWQATIETSVTPTILTYDIVLHDGTATRYLADDRSLDGGTGSISREPPDQRGWQISVYDPAFVTPGWTRGAVVYQIFPDRFFNGDPTNDPSPTATAGTEGPARFRYGDVYGNPVLVKSWDERPEGYCRAYQDVPCSEGPLGRDFFGGDLAGISAKLDELADLGVTALYLNPIFAAPSNHRYDTSDYFTVDPDLGTEADFDRLVAAARQRGMRVILDGVFNHVSSDSPWFDRYRRFADVGACEAADSPSRSWFTFRKPAGTEPAPCAPSTAGGDDTFYQGWAGFDTIPETQEVPAVVDLVTGPAGVVPTWLERGAAGWRLDVMDNLSDEFMIRIRAAAKTADPDALVLGEQWGDTSKWLLGNEADTTMNYRFRRAVIGLVNGDTADLDGEIGALRPTDFAAEMLAVQEDYPPPAFAALLNLVDSHDTTRILWTLTPGAENEAAKSDPAAVAEGKRRQRLVAAIQMTWPGMASIYYGDEVGLTGQDDPDDRRPYPWGTEDSELRAYYRTLAHLRADHAALREGDLSLLVSDDDHEALAWLRRTNDEAAVAVVNLSEREQSVTVPVAGRLPDGIRLADGLGGTGGTVTNGELVVRVAPGSAAVLVTEPGTDLAPPAVPGQPIAGARTGQVALSWPAVDGAAGYRVFRSIVSGGGYETVGDVEQPAFVDATVRNGTRYHYVVAALDDHGNVSGRSPEATALPELIVTEVRLEGPPAIQAPLSAAGPGASVGARVTVPGVAAGSGPPIGLRVQVGLGPGGSDPASSDGWTWVDAAYDAGAGPAAGIPYLAQLRPDAEQTFDVAARASTSDGATWIVGDLDGSANAYQVGQAVHLTAIAGLGSCSTTGSGPARGRGRGRRPHSPDLAGRGGRRSVPLRGAARREARRTVLDRRPDQRPDLPRPERGRGHGLRLRGRRPGHQLQSLGTLTGAGGDGRPT